MSPLWRRWILRSLGALLLVAGWAGYQSWADGRAWAAAPLLQVEQIQPGTAQLLNGLWVARQVGGQFHVYLNQSDWYPDRIIQWMEPSALFVEPISSAGYTIDGMAVFGPGRQLYQVESRMEGERLRARPDRVIAGGPGESAWLADLRTALTHLLRRPPAVQPQAPAPRMAVLTITAPLPGPATPNAPPSPGLTGEVPTYPPEDRGSWPEGLPRPDRPGALPDLELMLRQIEQTARPEPPGGAPLVWVGTLEGDRYVYHLGGPPRPDVPTTYMLQRQPEGWTATPICEGARWLWPGTRSQTRDPVVICGSSEGSGAVLSLGIYKAGRHVLQLGGIQEGVLQIRPREEAPPDLVITGKLEWMDHKLDPWVTERFTYRWTGERYERIGHERMADRHYYLARFVRSLAAGEIDRAAQAMAEPPSGGLSAYLQQQASDLERLAGARFTTDGFACTDRIYMHEPRSDAPWFWFDFGPDGRITALGQQPAAPSGR